jgi:hypothetical protein
MDEFAVAVEKNSFRFDVAGPHLLVRRDSRPRLEKKKIAAAQ